MKNEDQTLSKDAAPVGRFAPTPSGSMHLGNAFCALLAYLSAKHGGGKFLLRIEDLDAERCPTKYADRIMRELETLGLFWDGEVLWQSKRAEIYREAFERLRERERIYPCFCSRASLHAAEAPHLSDGSVLYVGACRNLTEAEIAERSAVRKPAMRIRVPDLEISFRDGLRGAYRQNLQRECGDFVLRRADGVFAYQLAVVTDDALSGVTEVVRGEDLLSSTPRQIFLAERLGFRTPAYFHVPLLTDGAGRRLAKRDGDSLSLALERYGARGVLGALACAAGILETPEPVSAQELVPLFDWRKVAEKCAQAPHVSL